MKKLVFLNSFFLLRELKKNSQWNYMPSIISLRQRGLQNRWLQQSLFEHNAGDQNCNTDNYSSDRTIIKLRLLFGRWQSEVLFNVSSRKTRCTFVWGFCTCCSFWLGSHYVQIGLKKKGDKAQPVLSHGTLCFKWNTFSQFKFRFCSMLCELWLLFGSFYRWSLFRWASFVHLFIN